MVSDRDQEDHGIVTVCDLSANARVMHGEDE